MLVTFKEASALIKSGKWLHIAANETLLRILPRGNWIGGSAECLMTDDGEIDTGDRCFVDVMLFDDCKIAEYSEENIDRIAVEAFDNGFSLIILPYDSGVHKIYSAHAPNFQDIFLKNIVGWVSGTKSENSLRAPVSVNGQTGEVYTDKCVALHVGIGEDKSVDVDIINIFEKRDVTHNQAQGMSGYEHELSKRIEELKDEGLVYSCNCVLNLHNNSSEYESSDSLYELPFVNESGYPLLAQSLVYLKPR